MMTKISKAHILQHLKALIFSKIVKSFTYSISGEITAEKAINGFGS